MNSRAHDLLHQFLSPGAQPLTAPPPASRPQSPPPTTLCSCGRSARPAWVGGREQTGLHTRMVSMPRRPKDPPVEPLEGRSAGPPRTALEEARVRRRLRDGPDRRATGGAELAVRGLAGGAGGGVGLGRAGNDDLLGGQDQVGREAGGAAGRCAVFVGWAGGGQPGRHEQCRSRGLAG